MRLVSNRRLDLLRHLHNLLDSERRGKKLLPLQSDIAASVLIVLFHALGLGSRERGGRTRPQKGESQHNTPTTLVLHVCASQSRFQPITRDLGSHRKMPSFALSRRQRGFESRWGHQIKLPLTRPDTTARQPASPRIDRQGTRDAGTSPVLASADLYISRSCLPKDPSGWLSMRRARPGQGWSCDIGSGIARNAAGQ
jgi:hypothetical protein